jgi:hypothetical protein
MFQISDRFIKKSAEMPPFKSLSKCEAAAKGQGLGSMTDFFVVKGKNGRPSCTSPNAGRPTGAEKTPAQVLAAPPAEAAKAPSDKPKKPKLTRANWSKGEGFKKWRMPPLTGTRRCSSPKQVNGLPLAR